MPESNIDDVYFSEKLMSNNFCRDTSKQKSINNEYVDTNSDIRVKHLGLTNEDYVEVNQTESYHHNKVAPILNNIDLTLFINEVSISTVY